jgi:hypothetical protein
MKMVNLDEVFVNLKEISNPGHPHDSSKCGCRGSGGVDRKKSKEEASKKKNPIFDDRDGQHATLGALNTESFCECVLSCVKLVVSDLHDSLKPSEIRTLVMLRMNCGFMEYMRKTCPNTPLSEFRVPDAYVHTHGLDALVDDEEEGKDEEV